MLEGKDLILATKPFAQEIRYKSWLYLLSTILILLSVYTGIFWNNHLLFKILCSILAGLILVRMFIIYHDYLHNAILQKSFIAKSIFTIFGLYILAPTSIWKRTHDYHHTHNSKLYTSSIGSFPTVTKKKFLASPKNERNIYLFIRHPLTIAFGYFSAFVWGMCILSLIRQPKMHWDSAISLLFHYTIGAIIFSSFGLQGFLLGFLIPSMISSAIGSYLFYAQHNFPGVTFKDKDGWTYVNAALSSSSYMKMDPVMEWFTGNIGYHHIHHVNARIPFYRLPEVFNKIAEFQNAKTTSLLPLDIIKCLHLKVWDPDSNRMITRKEIYA